MFQHAKNCLINYFSKLRVVQGRGPLRSTGNGSMDGSVGLISWKIDIIIERKFQVRKVLVREEMNIWQLQLDLLNSRNAEENNCELKDKRKLFQVTC
jgi:hypothetical protein